jgi:hypothetical protein
MMDLALVLGTKARRTDSGITNWPFGVLTDARSLFTIMGCRLVVWPLLPSHENWFVKLRIAKARIIGFIITAIIGQQNLVWEAGILRKFIGKFGFNLLFSLNKIFSIKFEIAKSN